MLTHTRCSSTLLRSCHSPLHAVDTDKVHKVCMEGLEQAQLDFVSRDTS